MYHLSASVQIRVLFVKAKNILWLYAQYTGRNIEERNKISPEEKEPLLDLFIHELRIVIDQFGEKYWLESEDLFGRCLNKLFG